MQFGAGRALDAVIRPEGLVHRHRLGKLDDVEYLKETYLVMHIYTLSKMQLQNEPPVPIRSV